jgi:hypothetical protein
MIARTGWQGGRQGGRLPAGGLLLLTHLIGLAP